MSLKYNEYLHEHCSGVRKGLQWMADNLAGVDHDILDKAMFNAEVHDNSKMQPEEYKAYDDYFYSGNKTAKVKEAFDYAWLHQKIKPFREKAKYARYSKTRFGNFLGLQYRETGVWMIFDLNGVPVCTCEDGELDSTLNELENAS